MIIQDAIQRRPRRIAQQLIALYRDEAEQIVYLAQNITFKERDLLLESLKIRRIQLFSLRGYE